VYNEYADQLTGHGIRATISTALNEIGYPKNWIDAQLSHADPDQVSATYNHARYVEQRRTMMQDWANRLDLWAQGKLEAASSTLTIRLEGTVSLPVTMGAVGSSMLSEMIAQPKRAKSSLGADGHAPASRLSAPENDVVAVAEPMISDIQRERLAMLAAYEEPTNLTVPEFARLAGKSHEQVSREIKTGQLLAIGLGNRGLRVPNWQLDPVRLLNTQDLMAKADGLDPWKVYRVLSDQYKFND
jgi:hypothetical protein